MATLGDTLTTTTYPDASGGAALALVSGTTVTVSSTTVTFSGLSGDGIHSELLIIGRISNLGADSANYEMRPNGVTTNQAAERIDWAGGGVVNSSFSSLQFAGIGPADGIVSFRILFMARESEGGNDMKRIMIADCPISEPLGLITHGIWEGSGNLTSLEFVCNVASGIGPGSTFTIYRYLRS